MYNNKIIYADYIVEYSIYCKLYINMKLKIKFKKKIEIGSQLQF